MEEYDWQVSKYIPEDSPKQYSIDELLHDLRMTKDARRLPPRSLKEHVQVWEQNHEATLTRAQQRILHAIGQELDYAYSVGIWGREQTREEIEQLMALSTQDTSQWREDLALATKRHDALMLKAWRAGLSGHPLVIDWRLTYRSLGYRNILRRAKSGLERGTQAPIEPGEAGLMTEVLQRQAAKENLHDIYTSFIEQKRIRTSWQAFHKWVKRNDLYSPPESLWHIPHDVWLKLDPIIEQYDPPYATGRSRIDARVTLEALVHKQRTDMPWNKLPTAFPDYRSVHRTFQRWQELGLLRRIWPILQAGCRDLPDLR